MTADIAVVIPSHDRPDLLSRTLRSVLWQQEVVFEVVVVDDGSNRLATALVEQLNDSRVSVVPSDAPNGGPCAARNTGVRATHAPWIAFLDDDDLWAPRKLAAQLRAAHAMPEAGWVTTGAVAVDSSLQVTAWQAPPAPGLQVRQIAVNLIPGGGSATMVARAVVEQVGGFDQSMRHHGDYEMWVRVSLVAPLATAPGPLTGYLRHSGGLSRGTSGGRAAKAQLRPELERLQRERGVEPAFDSWELIWGDLELRSGRRRDAARTYGRLAVARRDPRLLARAGLAALSPQTLLQRSERWEASRVPDDVRREADDWLQLLRGL